MTGPPKHLKDPLKVTIRRKKLLTPGPTGLPRRTQVVNSNEIIMVTKRPVAVRSRSPRASRTAAVPGLMIVLKEAMEVNHRANGKVIRRGQILTTAPKELLTATVIRKALNQEVHHTLVGHLQTTGLKEAMAVIRVVRKENINQGAHHIREGHLRMTDRKEATVVSQTEKKENINQEAHHTREGRPRMTALKEAMVVNRVEKRKALNRGRTLTIVQNAVSMINQTANGDQPAIKAESAVAAVSKNAKATLKASPSATRKTHPITTNR